jgi:hypothetical protein
MLARRGLARAESDGVTHSNAVARRASETAMARGEFRRHPRNGLGLESRLSSVGWRSDRLKPELQTVHGR